MNEFKFSRFLLLMLYIIIGIGVCIIPFFASLELSFQIGELYNDVELMGITGWAEALSYLLFMMLMIILPYIVLVVSCRLAGIIKPKFPYLIMTTSLKVNREHLNVEKMLGSYFYRADDKFLIIRIKDRKFACIIFFIAFILFSIISINGIIEQDLSMDNEYGLYFDFALIALIFLLYNLFYPAKEIVFDRMHSSVIVPNFLILPSAVVSIDKLITGNVMKLQSNMGVVHPLTYSSETIPGFSNSEWWSFYMWYMDKNRPLPPGTLLDNYREKDFTRRKEEGFPAPLFDSYPIITDDRYGYLDATDDFRNVFPTMCLSIPKAYDLVYSYIYKNTPSIIEEDIILVGVWQSHYLFRLCVPLHQKLYIIDDNEIQTNCYLVDKKGRVFAK